MTGKRLLPAALGAALLTALMFAGCPKVDGEPTGDGLFTGVRITGMPYTLVNEGPPREASGDSIGFVMFAIAGDVSTQAIAIVHASDEFPGVGIPEIVPSGNTSKAEAPLFTGGMEYSVSLQNWRKDKNGSAPKLPQKRRLFQEGSKKVEFSYATVAEQEVGDASSLTFKSWTRKFPDDLDADGYLNLVWGTWDQ